ASDTYQVCATTVMDNAWWRGRQPRQPHRHHEHTARLQLDLRRRWIFLRSHLFENLVCYKNHVSRRFEERRVASGPQQLGKSFGIIVIAATDGFRAYHLGLGCCEVRAGKDVVVE